MNTPTWKKLATIVTLAAVALGGGYALKSSLDGDCCKPGAECCKPGAACCNHHKPQG